MKTCKVKPTADDCCSCMDIAETFDSIPDCKTCIHNTKRYELIEIVTNFWGSSAILQADGELKKVSLSRIYDIRDEPIPSTSTG